MASLADRLGQIHALLNRSEAASAAAAVAALLQDHPEDPGVLRALAMVQQATGLDGAAVESMQRAVRRAPNDPVLHDDLGRACMRADRLDEAIAAFSEVARLRPEAVASWHLLGMAALAARRDAQAVAALRRAHGLAPERQDIRFALAEAEFANDDVDAALALYEAIAAAAGAMEPMVELRRSQSHRRMGRVAQARVLLLAALDRFPDHAALWMEIGGVHEDLGSLDDAAAAYRRAHALAPGWGDPVGAALALGRGNVEDALLRAAEAMVASDAMPVGQRAFLHHALGKHRDAQGAYAAAATHWQQANQLRRATQPAFDRAAAEAGVDAVVRVFTPSLLQARHATALRDERPLFVVGLPRSGSTLVEQILASHPQVQACGERPDIEGVAAALAVEAGQPWPQCVAGASVDWLRSQSLGYLGDSPAAGEGLRRRVDKWPFNVPFLGLVAMLFADARIVWCRRDPRDVALSTFSESFSPKVAYATDLDDIACMIRLQDRLMRHWQAVLPLPILELRYEELVADPEAQTRRLIDFAGLPWDRRCLAFHENARAVQTLSRWQVRQPVHARSVGRWRHYAPWLGLDSLPLEA